MSFAAASEHAVLGSRRMTVKLARVAREQREFCESINRTLSEFVPGSGRRGALAKPTPPSRTFLPLVANVGAQRLLVMRRVLYSRVKSARTDAMADETQPSPPPAIPQTVPRTPAVAIWSLILAVLSFTCGWLFTAIPAVICGHIAR